MPNRPHPDTAPFSDAARDGGPRDGGPREAAQYIKSAIEDLATLARVHRLDLLGYLLDMARQEAADAVGRTVHGPL